MLLILPMYQSTSYRGKDGQHFTHSTNIKGKIIATKSKQEQTKYETRPSALGISDPVIESQEIKETQEFPSIQNVEGGEEDERGGGSEGDDEKR